MRHKSISLLDSFKHAFDGVFYVVTHERNARIHFTITLLIIILALWLQIDILHWALLWLAIGLVFTSEMLNTVAELLVDLAVQQVHPMAKTAKDVAAGAVLLMAFVAVIIGTIVLGPPLLERLSMLLSGAI